MHTIKIRELKTSDIFKVSKILKRMNLKVNEIASENDTGKKSSTQVGIQIILTALENLHLAEKEVNEFLADLAGISSVEFAELPLQKTLEIIKEVKNISGITNFLRSADQLTT